MGYQDGKQDFKVTKTNPRILAAIGFPIGVPLAIALVWSSLAPFPSLLAAGLTFSAVACILGFGAGWTMGRLGLSILLSTPIGLALLGYGNRLPMLYGEGVYDLVNILFPFIYVLLFILPSLLVSVLLGGFFRARKERNSGG